METLVLEVGRRAAELAATTRNASLATKTAALTDKYAQLVSYRSAIHIVGTASEIASAAFSTDPELGKLHPDMLKEVQTVGMFVSNQNAEAGEQRRRVEAQRWIEDHADSLETVVPGIQYRHNLAKMRQTLLEESLAVLDPEALLEGPGKVSDAKMRELDKKLGEAGERERSKLLLSFMEESLPGLGKWFELEERMLIMLSR
jgi:hypothetical protein